MTELATRGTTNRNDRGSSYNRAARRAWLLETYRADVDAITVKSALSGSVNVWFAKTAADQVYLLDRLLDDEYFTVESVKPACRCYRCGFLLTGETLTVDRIIPGCMGGTYRRNNIRPACGPCNIHTGNQVRDARRKS